MPQRWNDREGRFDVEPDGDFDRERGYGYDAGRRRDPAYDYDQRDRGRRHGDDFLRAAQQGGDIGYGRARSGADYGAGAGGYRQPGDWGRVGGHDFGSATGDYGRSGGGRTADYGDERYFDHRDRDRYAYGVPSRDRGFAPRGGERSAHDEDRSWFDRARDEVSSWMGDHDAQRRREADGAHRGRGPKGYRRSDERVRDDINDRLTDDSWLDAHGIEVAVENGDVTLSGTVRSREDKKRAEALVERVSGVDNVQNNLRVDRGTEAAATAVPTSPPLG
ncbi:BON domain-containing protein [uncultured Caulobacter sp.]|jgi:osmotically-inducible protein OsmY|uniref:BON domain-containing protein n=1 Tax=uncultured Caulobacter sp. TaxID=158749 RepID=UPI002632B591|nr:BON domain-containing protein [uncultured Caulobacter sp.]